jgi:hypothetical protein
MNLSDFMTEDEIELYYVLGNLSRKHKLCFKDKDLVDRARPHYVDISSDSEMAWWQDDKSTPNMNLTFDGAVALIRIQNAIIDKCRELIKENEEAAEDAYLDAKFNDVNYA